VKPRTRAPGQTTDTPPAPRSSVKTHGKTARPNGAKDALRFAANFSAYILPQDVVCLYSEDRKFFLHGPLYCALAPAIAAGKNIEQLLSEFGSQFPSDKIHEALQRLLDRGFIVRDSPFSSSITAAYTGTLGLSPETAEKNIQKTRVRLQSIDVEGATELNATLSRLGVQSAKRSAELNIILVNDYLDERLADLNLRHLADETPWLLVQPSGIFPLVGPVFRPGKGPCWVCLAERMKRNREVKAFLDRTKATCVSSSALANRSFGESGIQLAAVEIAKAIAADFRTELRDHIVSLDLLGSAVAKHYVAARPQCPICGSKELRDPRRAPKPIELGTGDKLIMTSGGFRAVSPAATVAQYRKHVSLLTGVVSRLERIKADLPLNTNFFATHNFAARPETVDELKTGLSGGSFGKGSSAEQGEASALMEAIERYSCSFQGDEIRIGRRFTDFPKGDAILPNDVMLFSNAQHGSEPAHAASPNQSGFVIPFDQSAKIEWSPVWSLADEQFRYLPTSLMYFFYKGPNWQHLPAADSNGCAAGNTLKEAIVQGFLELVERDSYAIWWYNRLQRPEVDLSQFDDPYVRDLQILFADTGRRLWVLDITSDLGIPSFVAISHWIDGSQEQIEFGSGAHFDARIAMLRTLTELNQFISIGMMGCRSAGKLMSPTGPNELRLKNNPYLAPSGMVQTPSNSDFSRLDSREQVMACVRIAKQAGLDFLVLDQTRPDIEVPVVRVVVPGLRHFYRRFAPGRLFDVPVKLGLRDQPLSEDQLNPLHPRT
jgi:ribosomal protein S12 methylthiotransferase accessory factor